MSNACLCNPDVWSLIVSQRLTGTAQPCRAAEKRQMHLREREKLKEHEYGKKEKRKIHERKKERLKRIEIKSQIRKKERNTEKYERK